jgi:hypothetical protein
MAMALIVRAAWRARLGLHGVTPIALLVLNGVGAMSGNPITVKLFWLTLAYAVAAAVPIVRESPAPATAPLRSSLPMVRA